MNNQLTCKLGFLCKKDLKHTSPILHCGGTNNAAIAQTEYPTYATNIPDKIKEIDGHFIMC